jgi:hypothetical protein
VQLFPTLVHTRLLVDVGVTSAYGVDPLHVVHTMHTSGTVEVGAALCHTQVDVLAVQLFSTLVHTRLLVGVGTTSAYGVDPLHVVHVVHTSGTVEFGGVLCHMQVEVSAAVQLFSTLVHTRSVVDVGTTSVYGVDPLHVVHTMHTSGTVEFGAARCHTQVEVSAAVQLFSTLVHTRSVVGVGTTLAKGVDPLHVVRPSHSRSVD